MVPGPVGYNEPAQWTHNKEEYVRHFKGTAFIAIGAIARKVAMQPAKVYYKVATKHGLTRKGGVTLEPVEFDHPLPNLFDQVNPIHTQYDLWYQMVCWRLMTGDTYWWKTRNRFGGVVELWPLPSQWVWAIPSTTKFIDRYLVRGVFGPEVQMPAEDVLHIREPSIDYSSTGGARFYGKPMITAADTAVDLEEAMFRRLYHQFRNFTPPGLVFSTEQPLGEDQFLDLMAQLKTQQARSEKTGEPIVAHSGMKVGEFRESVREMDYSRSLETVADHIMAVAGTPKSVVGLTADYNRSNLEGAILCWAENTINPLLAHLGQHLTQNLAIADFDNDVVVKFDPVTTDDREAIRADVGAAVSAKAITPNEVREVLLKRERFTRGGDNPVGSPQDVEVPTWGDGKEPEPPPEPKEEKPAIEIPPQLAGMMPAMPPVKKPPVKVPPKGKKPAKRRRDEYDDKDGDDDE